MLHPRRPSGLATSIYSVFVLVTLVCCAGCGNKESVSTPAGATAPVQGGTSSLPPQAQAAAQAQEKADAAAHAARAPR